MTKPMKYRKLAKLLTDAGFVNRGGKGDHENWENAAITVTIVHDTECSPGVTRKALQAIEKSKQK
ncbi:MAG: type II toxin-antitoxin system HicA family toxin [Actinomycetaceae bacterium]|nr:type II toxin-antitoxin system HicA family toxin [Arcanobacterium sp.]MDD7505568.1 type II toxin-antitoxin system HicA family toxin [Actinomycetaceae bacterium]MDY6143813.1 type II toxin-antitoxin system HicA family toxin [Arcanobacterium sp.]